MIVLESIKVLETTVFKLKVHPNGFAELLIKNNALFDTKDILEGKEFITDILNGRKSYILVEHEGDIYTTKEARELASSPLHAAHHGAVALSSNKLAYKILGMMYIKINRPKAPTKFFDDRYKAEEWLRSLMPK